jgi:aldehyde dehydrogenase (NAD+)
MRKLATASRNIWRASMFENYDGRNYIGGEWRGATSTFETIDPCTEEVCGRFPQSLSDVDDAVESAKASLAEWRSTSRIHRAEILYRVAKIIERDLDKLATAISEETGKNYNESIAEVNEALHMAQYAFGTGRMPHGEVLASEIPEKDAYMLRKPKGVVAIISPWNFPLAIGAFWCAAPALVEGNTVVIKPSEDAPLSTELAVQIYEEVGLPAGVLNLVHGDGAVGDYLARHDVDHICFTGSAEVGQHIRRVCADSWHKTCSCEMGSKSAVIVCEDGSLDLAVSASVASSFKLSGQRCVSAGRLIVHRSIYDEFAASFGHYAQQVNPGPPLMDDIPSSLSYMGPLINSNQLDRVKEFNLMVIDDPEAEVLVSPEYFSPGYYVSPMVYKTEWRDVPYLKNEVFGPHVAIIPFDTIDHAISIYNDTDYGLSVGIITENFKVARRMRDECDYGLGYWNGGSIAAESHLGFGGVKKSGNGFPSAARTVRAVTHEVAWTVNHDDELSFPQGMK